MLFLLLITSYKNNMEWFGIVALLLLLCYSAYPGKVKRLETKVKRLEKKQRGVAYMSKLINDLVGKQCIIRSEFIFSFAGKTELSCKIIDADDEWIKICYTEKKDKQVVKLMRIENIDSIAVKGRNPRYLKLPRGYEYNVKLKAITNNSIKFNVIHK